MDDEGKKRRSHAPVPPGEEPSPRPGGETPLAVPLRVLIVDDEPTILFALDRMLKECDVATAASGREALDRIEAGCFDVVLCDLMMPDMTGMDVHDTIRARTPGLERRMIFMTGGTSMPIVVEFLGSIENRRLEKPFSTAALRRAVRDLLAELGPAA